MFLFNVYNIFIYLYKVSFFITIFTFFLNVSSFSKYKKNAKNTENKQTTQEVNMIKPAAVECRNNGRCVRHASIDINSTPPWWYQLNVANKKTYARVKILT